MRTTAEVLRKEGYDKGYDKGVVLGEQHGKLEATQETLIDVAGERYGLLSSVLEAKIKSIKSITTLKNLARQVVKLDRIEDFERLVNKAVDH